ncbi:MAG: beta-hexosaminidase, partial [Proteobacteria bacterium]|nr:beta-hexosaminidase [Pseudomonadota bacterium]
APVLIDQEGGRVQRLNPPHWRARPAQGIFAKMHAADPETAIAAARLNAKLIANDILSLGVDVDCLPLLDVPQPSGHDIIGDRAYGDDPVLTATLGQAVCDGLAAGGVTPVLKHIPGHGRALVDSHLSLPIVDAELSLLASTDFAPFKALAATAPESTWAMTAHVVYTAIDGARPATTSATVIADVIRKEIGFGGFLITDDLGMQALGGDFSARAEASLAAGCDCVLHCNGDMVEMQAVMATTPALSDSAWARFSRARQHRRPADAIDIDASEAQLADWIRAWI